MATRPFDPRNVGAGALAFAVAFFCVSALLPRRPTDDALGWREALEVEARDSAHAELARRELDAPGPEPRTEAPAEPTLERREVPEPAFHPAAPAAPQGMVIFGHVTDPDGAPIPRTHVWTTSIDGEHHSGNCDVEGRYALGPFVGESPFGSYEVLAGGNRYRTAKAIVPCAGDSVRQDFVLEVSQTIRIRLVTSAGTPAMPELWKRPNPRRGLGLQPVATREDPGDVFELRDSNANATFGIGSFGEVGYTGLAPLTPDEIGTVTLTEPSPGWMSLIAGDQVIRKQRIDPSTESVVFTLDVEDILALACTIRATLLDAETLEPVEADLWLERERSRSGPRLGRSRSDGTVELEGAVTGLRYLIVQADGYANKVLELRLVPDEVHDLGTIALQRPISLSGRSVNGSGAPIAASLRCGRWDPETEDVDWSGARRWDGEPDGSFEVCGLEPGQWAVRAVDPSGRREVGAGIVLVDARGGSIYGLEFVMVPTQALTVRVANADGARPRIVVRDAQGFAAASAVVDASDLAPVFRLPGGRYTVEVLRDDQVVATRSAVLAGAPVGLTVEL